MTADPIRAIADAVLYEGYILWPYRRSALKNQQRFTFGGVYPPAHAAHHPDDPALMQAEVLVRGDPQTEIRVLVRFLHVVQRTVARRTAEGFSPVDELTVAGERHLSWQEAVEREITLPAAPLAQLLAGPRTAPIALPAGAQSEPLVQDGTAVGEIRRSWERLDGRVSAGAAAVDEGLYRLTVRIANRTAFDGDRRGEAQRRTLCCTHALLSAGGGAFASLTDVPAALASAAAGCQNIGCWPVLVGEPGRTDRMLCSPIILEDHPRVAPESPGDLFDGGEIDQLLVLNILALTDAEKAEMAASDPRAREILRRTESLTPEQIMRLHGAVREFGMVR